jgi:hypothetical protein
MTRRSLSVVMLLAFVAALGGAVAYRSCAYDAVGDGSTNESARSANVSAPSLPATAPAPAPAPAPSVSVTAAARQRESVQLTVYFPSRRYIESGDETLPQLVAEPFELDVADAGASVDTRVRALLAALEAGPKTAAATRAIPERLVIRHVHVRDGVAYVDFSRAELAGGSLEETLLVKTIVRTLTGVPQVRAVQFLVEGKVPETLMGHVTTTQPISVVD